MKIKKQGRLKKYSTYLLLMSLLSCTSIDKNDTKPELDELKVKKKVSFISFPSNSANLPLIERQDLRLFVNTYSDKINKKGNDSYIIIEGHTDLTDEEKRSQDLAKMRALSVRQALIEMGVNKEKVLVKGNNGKKPLISDDSQFANKLNRRVVVKIAVVDDRELKRSNGIPYIGPAPLVHPSVDRLL